MRDSFIYRRYEIIWLGHAKYPNFYRLKISDGEKIEPLIIENIFYHENILNGKKPDGISMFMHIKICLVLGTEIRDTSNHELKNQIFKSKDQNIEAGYINFGEYGRCKLIIDNNKERVYFEKPPKFKDFQKDFEDYYRKNESYSIIDYTSFLELPAEFSFGVYQSFFCDNYINLSIVPIDDSYFRVSLLNHKADLLINSIIIKSLNKAQEQAISVAISYYSKQIDMIDWDEDLY